MNNYDRALLFATIKHKGKYRKGLSHKEYITHPIAVSKLVEKYMRDDDEIETFKVAALLHDTIEDGNTTYEELKEIFGEKVATIVQDLSSNKIEQKKIGKDLYLSNKMLNMNDKTLTLKLCDRLHNVSELIDTSDDFKNKYIKETTYLVNSILMYRELNQTHLMIINDIMMTIKSIANVNNNTMHKKLLIQYV